MHEKSTPIRLALMLVRLTGAAEEKLTMAQRSVVQPDIDAAKRLIKELDIPFGYRSHMARKPLDDLMEAKVLLMRSNTPLPPLDPTRNLAQDLALKVRK